MHGDYKHRAISIRRGGGKGGGGGGGGRDHKFKSSVALGLGEEFEWQ